MKRCSHENFIVKSSRFRYDVFAGWSSLVARWAHNPKVAGSNPAPATMGAFREYREAPFLLSVAGRAAIASFPTELIR